MTGDKENEQVLRTRQAFEKWATEPNQDGNVERDRDGEYVSSPVRVAWAVWQAAEEQNYKVIAELRELLMLAVLGRGSNGYCEELVKARALAVAPTESIEPIAWRWTSLLNPRWVYQSRKPDGITMTAVEPLYAIHVKPLEHVAWLQFSNHNETLPITIHLCASDDPGAFKVYSTPPVKPIEQDQTLKKWRRAFGHYFHDGAELCRQCGLPSDDPIHDVSAALKTGPAASIEQDAKRTSEKIQDVIQLFDRVKAMIAANESENP